MRIGVCLILSGSLALACIGCNSPQFNTPQLRAPGTTAEERLQAQQFDPYPDPKIGVDFAGSRPRDFDIPRPPPRLAPPPTQPYAVAPAYAAPPMVLSGPAQPYVVNPQPVPAPYVVAPAPYSPPAPLPSPAAVPAPSPIYNQSPSPIATPTPGYDPYAIPH
jgi:hypothetical protein